VGVTAQPLCRTCGSSAPKVGDFGYVGYPTLDDSSDEANGMASFGFLHRGYASLGIRFLELDLLHGWLEEHAGHDVTLSMEGHEIGSGRAYKLPPPSLRVGRPDPAAYARSFFELRCQRCDKAHRTKSSYLLLPADGVVGPADARRFQDRVLEAETESFHRCFGLLDPWSDEFQGLGSFLREHQRHTLRSRTVSGETWTVPGWAMPDAVGTPTDHVEEAWGPSRVPPRVSLPPPLRVTWFRQASIKAPVLVCRRRVVTLGGKREWVVALDMGGEELWRTRAEEEYSHWSLFASGDLIWAPTYSKADKLYRLQAIEAATGRVAEGIDDTPRPHTFVADRAFLGQRYRPRDHPIETFGLYRVGEVLETVWEIEVPSIVGQGLGWRCASDGERVFIDHGADVVALSLQEGGELWRAQLGQFGKPWGGGGHRLSVADGIVVYGLIGSIHGLSAATGQILWTLQGRDASLEQAVYGGAVTCLGSGYFGRFESSRFLRVNSRTGEVLTSVQTDAPAWAETPEPRPLFTDLPRPTDDVVYVGDRDGRLWALSPNGTPVWCRGLPETAGWLEDIVVAGGCVFVRDGSGRRYCLTPEGPPGSRSD